MKQYETRMKNQRTRQRENPSQNDHIFALVQANMMLIPGTKTAIKRIFFIRFEYIVILDWPSTIREAQYALIAASRLNYSFSSIKNSSWSKARIRNLQHSQTIVRIGKFFEYILGYYLIGVQIICMKAFIFNTNTNQNFKLQVNQVQLRRIELLKDMKLYFSHKLYQAIPENYLCNYNIISKEDADLLKYSKLFSKKVNLKQLEISERQSRSIASLVGLSIGDALGSTTEFEDYEKFRKEPFFKNGFKDLEEKLGDKVHDRFGQTRVWTDDCSMALAMADSLLLNKLAFDPIHIRYMFTLWLRHGLDNGGRQSSIGLGGNISLSMSEFMENQLQFTEKGTQQNNGNGSLMRLAPIPIAFRNSKEEAMKYAGLQSLTTHNGFEAAESSSLLAGLIVTLINRKNQDKWRDQTIQFLNKFQTKCPQVKCLALSKRQSLEIFEQQKKKLNGRDLQNFNLYNSSIEDRNWDWQDKDFSYSKHRVEQNSGYIGSYCMDGLAMALHIVWFTKSFKDCAIWAANMGGDCDTVGAIACQIAGAIYGFNHEVLSLYSQMKDFTSKKYSVFIKAFKLAKGKQRKIIFNANQ